MLRRRRYGLSAFHPSERVEEILQVLGHCSAPGQVFIRDRGWAHSNDDRPNMLVLPELPGIGPLRRDQAAVPMSSGLQQSVSLSYGCHG
jgi:nitrogen fixation protein